jgi:hypothetical protein
VHSNVAMPVLVVPTQPHRLFERWFGGRNPRPVGL